MAEGVLRLRGSDGRRGETAEGVLRQRGSHG